MYISCLSLLMRSKPTCSAKWHQKMEPPAVVRGHVVFVDESGDLGLSPGASETITVCGVSTTDCRHLERIPRRLRRRLIARKMRERSELKFYNSTQRVREHALHSLASISDARVIALTARKSQCEDSIREDPDGFYLSLCGALAECLPMASSPAGKIRIVFDARRGNRSRGDKFDDVILKRTLEGYRRAGHPEPDVRVSRMDSLNSMGLQVADFATGAIHRWHEHGDDRYRKIIESVIAIDSPYARGA